MLAALALSAALLAAMPVQDPTPADQEPAVRLEDVVSNPRTLREATEEFVGEVAAPVRRRGMGRWHGGVCVGSANLTPEVSQFLVDRVSDVARDLGLVAGAPGCHPSILVVAATDSDRFAREFVEMRPALFRPGGSGMDRGGAALRRFLAADAPVRWWAVSQPTDADTGQPAVRMPGQCNRSCIGSGSAMDYAPITAVRSAARLSSQYRQDIKRTFVIVDVDKLGGVTLAQLADYIAFVSLAQVDPEADTARYDTILNLFDSPGAVDGLTGWDTAYLRGLYESEWYRINQDSQVRAISHTITNEYRNIGRAGD